MIKWILIVLIMLPQPETFTLEFESEKNCRKAERQIEREATESIRGERLSEEVLVVACVKHGKIVLSEEERAAMLRYGYDPGRESDKERWLRWRERPRR